MDRQIEWFCYNAVNEKLLTPEVCKEIGTDYADDGTVPSLDDFVATVVDNGLCTNTGRLKQLADLARSQADVLGMPPSSVFAGTMNRTNQPASEQSSPISTLRGAGQIAALVRQSCRGNGKHMVTVGVGAAILIAILLSVWGYQRHQDTEAFRKAVSGSAQAVLPETMATALVKYTDAWPKGRYRLAAVKQIERVLCEQTVTNYDSAVALRDTMSHVLKAVPDSELTPAAKEVLQKLDDTIIKPEVQFRQAEAFLKTAGVDQAKQAEAFALYESAAKAGHIFARFRIGQCCEIGFGVYRNEKRAFACYKDAAERGSAEACAALGRCYLNGVGAPVELQSAIKWLKQAYSLELGGRSSQTVAQSGTEKLLREAQRKALEERGLVPYPLIEAADWGKEFTAGTPAGSFGTPSATDGYFIKDSLPDVTKVERLTYLVKRASNDLQADWQASDARDISERQRSLISVLGLAVYSVNMACHYSDGIADFSIGDQLAGLAQTMKSLLKTTYGYLFTPSADPDWNDYMRYVVNQNLVNLNAALSSKGLPLMADFSVDVLTSTLDQALQRWEKRRPEAWKQAETERLRREKERNAPVGLGVTIDRFIERYGEPHTKEPYGPCEWDKSIDWFYHFSVKDNHVTVRFHDMGRGYVAVDVSYDFRSNIRAEPGGDEIIADLLERNAQGSSWGNWFTVEDTDTGLALNTKCERKDGGFAIYDHQTVDGNESWCLSVVSGEYVPIQNEGRKQWAELVRKNREKREMEKVEATKRRMSGL